MKLRPKLLLLFFSAALLGLPAQAGVPEVKWDSRSLIIGGRRVVPVMGEVHYSRIPADEWEREVRKMKEARSDNDCQLRLLEPC